MAKWSQKRGNNLTEHFLIRPFLKENVAKFSDFFRKRGTILYHDSLLPSTLAKYVTKRQSLIKIFLTNLDILKLKSTFTVFHPILIEIFRIEFSGSEERG